MSNFKDFEIELKSRSFFDMNFSKFVYLFITNESKKPEHKKNLFKYCLDNEFIKHIKNDYEEYELETKCYYNHNEVTIENCNPSSTGNRFVIENFNDKTDIAFSSNNEHNSLYITLKKEHKVNNEELTEYTACNSKKRIRINRDMEGKLISFGLDYFISNIDGFCLFRYEISYLLEKSNLKEGKELYLESRGENNVFKDLHSELNNNNTLSKDFFEIINLKYDLSEEGFVYHLKNNFVERDNIKEIEESLKKLNKNSKKLKII